VPDDLSISFASLIREITHIGGLVIVPQNSAFIGSTTFLTELLDHCPNQQLQPSLGYGQKPVTSGFHIMQTLSDNWVECITGLGATGTEIMITLLTGREILRPTPSNPIVPLIRVAAPGPNPSKAIRDALEECDVTLTGDSKLWSQQILQEILAFASQTKQPKYQNYDFQICRGPLGISM